LAELLRRFGDVDYRIRHSPYAHLPLEIALVESSLEPAGPAAPVAGVESRSAPAPRPEEPAFDPGRPTSRLRDRVRSTSAPPRPATPLVPSPAEDMPSALPPARPPVSAGMPAPRANGSSAATPTPDAGILSVDQLAELWPRIRQDVKALNRRAEALLANADPARVVGNQITLTTPYEFHRDKLNSAEMRELVQTVIGRLAGGAVVVETRLPSELGVAPAPAAFPAANSDPVPESGPTSAPRSDPVVAETLAPPDNETHDERIRIALNIFDGEVLGEE
ncbi:MAG: hypothetical protein IT337_11725, partial [Thermomicrobiales bacterium]|nr:hypothetical protein [Thermomicrobiales bacterium]